MKLSDLTDIIEILPNAKLEVSGSAIMFKDNKGNLIGDLLPYTNTVTFYQGYKYFDVIEKKMKERRSDLFDRALNRELLTETKSMEDVG